MDIDDTMDSMDRDFTRRQRKYVETLSETFNMKNARGDIFPYTPQPYQIEYHADCMLANPNYPNRITKKSRGIGATAMTMIDALMVAHTYDNVKIPVASITGAQSDGPLEWSIWLADNTRIEGFFDRNESINSKCILGNASVIFPVPGHNPNALRNYRTIFNVYDEFAFHEYPKKLKAAGDACLSEGGQINALSTLNGTENEHYRLIENAEDFGYRVYSVPMFDPDIFDLTRSIPDQIKAGLIRPISPWASIRKLEEARKSDPVAFMQEYMCDPQDDSISFMSIELINKISRDPWKIEQTHRYGNNPYHLGVDFASDSDLSAFSVFEQTPYGWIQRMIKTLKKTDTVAQNELTRQWDMDFNFDTITIDMTGPGTGFFDYARADFGERAIPIHFASRWTINEDESHQYRKKDVKKNRQGKVSIPIKRAMATHMKVQAQKGRVLFLGYPEMRKDLHKVDYESLDASRDKEGHADRFWASALSMWGAVVNAQKVIAQPISTCY